MTTTQTSFSAFAATQTDLVDFAVSDQFGQRGFFLPSFPYPLPAFSVNPYHGTGFSRRLGLRDDYDSSERFQALDAPDHLPMGSFNSMEFGRRSSGYYFEVVAFGDVLRG